MMSVNRSELIPQPLLWICAIPFMILLFPIGFVYSLICLVLAILSKQPFRDYRHDIFFAMCRPGFYVGMFLAFLILILIRLPINRFSQAKDRINEEKMKSKMRDCKTWLETLPFLTHEMSEIKLYLSKEEAVGRIIIRDINTDQVKAIEFARESLPDRIHLELLPVKMLKQNM
jgi:hypothetical protein